MRNASCFIILSPVNDQLHFSKEAGKSNPLFVHKSPPNLSLKISYYAYECTQTVHSMISKSDLKWFETTPFWPIITSHLSLHPFQATTFTISQFGSTQESFYPQSSALVVVFHHFWFFCPMWLSEQVSDHFVTCIFGSPCCVT